MSGSRIRFTANGRAVDGYLASPDAPGPGVIVLQEWWGLVPHIEDVTDRFAAAGFNALAPDLYEGDTTTSPDDAGKLMMALDIAATAKTLEGAINLLRAHDATTSEKVGVVGFCMGGQLALYAAGAFPAAIGACVDFYGVHPAVKPDLAQLAGPVLGFFGEKDAFVTPAVVRTLEADLKAAGKSIRVEIFPGADHAFFNDTRREAFDSQAADRCWSDMAEFFRENLS